MSWTHKQRITVVAVVVLVVTAPVLWQVADVRAAQVAAEQREELTSQPVETRQSQSDYDGDGISDSTDECPTRPEKENGYQDSDGCPDVVETTGAS
jgi:hypothetical protein